jgi:hypothetical protein
MTVLSQFRHSAGLPPLNIDDYAIGTLPHTAVQTFVFPSDAGVGIQIKHLASQGIIRRDGAVEIGNARGSKF